MSKQEIEKSKWSNFPLHTEYECVQMTDNSSPNL